MPQDPPTPLSDLGHPTAQHDTPPDPIPETSGRTSTDRSIGASSSSDSRKHDGQQASTSSRVQSALREAADMDSVAEGEQAKKNKRWQRSSALQTIALDSHDLPAPTSSSQEVGPCLVTCGEGWVTTESSMLLHPVIQYLTHAHDQSLPRTSFGPPNMYAAFCLIVSSLEAVDHNHTSRKKG